MASSTASPSGKRGKHPSSSGGKAVPATGNSASCGLLGKRCRACEGGVPPLTDSQIKTLLREVSGWSLEKSEIVKTFQFDNYYQTMAFVNATAWISHHENHHPDLDVGYNRCKVRYSTHAVGGLSENDFICAAKVDALMFGQ